MPTFVSGCCLIQRRPISNYAEDTGFCHCDRHSWKRLFGIARRPWTIVPEYQLNKAHIAASFFSESSRNHHGLYQANKDGGATPILADKNRCNILDIFGGLVPSHVTKPPCWKDALAWRTNSWWWLTLSRYKKISHMTLMFDLVYNPFFETGEAGAFPLREAMFVVWVVAVKPVLVSCVSDAVFPSLK